MARQAEPGSRPSFRCAAKLSVGFDERGGVLFHVLSGALSNITDLAATVAATAMLVKRAGLCRAAPTRLAEQIFTQEGLVVAWAAGSTSGRRPRTPNPA